MSLEACSPAILPGGLTVGGRRHQEALLRPLTGREEELVAGNANRASAAERVTALLANCIVRLGPEKCGSDAVRTLSVGDREVLLLKVRSATLGERIQCRLACPSCGEEAGAEFTTDDILVPPYADFPTWYEEGFGGASETTHVRFRLPTGADQEAVAPLAARDAEGAAALLLRRCIDWVIDDGCREITRLNPSAAAAVASRMAELDPQAEIWLTLACPSCQAPIESLFDAAAFLFAEIASSSTHLYEEVHALAWHYHWAETEILNLTPRKRKRYLELIAANLSGTGGTA